MTTLSTQQKHTNDVLRVLQAHPDRWMNDFEISVVLGYDIDPEVMAEVGYILCDRGLPVEVEDGHTEQGMTSLRYAG